MKSPYMRHHNYSAGDQKMSNRSMVSWRSKDVDHIYDYRCYTDDGEYFRGFRTIFKAKVKANEDI